MKKFLIFFLATMLGFLGVSCDRLHWPPGDNTNNSYVDSSFVVHQIQLALNPEFYAVSDVIAYQDYLMSEADIDSAFLSIPYDVLANVAKVCINRDGWANKESIVLDFRRSSDVYTNLTTTTSESANLPATPTAPETVSPMPGDTIVATLGANDEITVNGKKYKRYEEK